MASITDFDHSVEEDNAKFDSHHSIEGEVLGSNDDYIDCYYPCGKIQQRLPIIEIDTQGDKVLIVGPASCRVGLDGVHSHQDQARFRVCSRSLARHSDCMAAMLFGRFRESTQTTIHLPEDDPDAMKTLLDISHGNFTPVFELSDRLQNSPLALRYLVTDDIYDIVSLADKYLMSQQLRPWASSWIPPLHPPSPQSDEYLSPDDVHRLEKAMFIACQFGNFKLFEDASERLVWVLRRDQEIFTSTIEPFFASEESPSSGPAEAGAADHLRKLRLQLIDSMVSPLRRSISGLNSFFNTPYPCETYSGGEIEVCTNCRMHTFGVMVLFLSREGLYPVPDATDVDMSPRDLHFRLTMHESGFRDGLWSDCDPLHSCEVRDCLNSHLRASKDKDSSFYSPPHRMSEKMRSRAKQFGFPEPW